MDLPRYLPKTPHSILKIKIENLCVIGGVLRPDESSKDECKTRGLVRRLASSFCVGFVFLPRCGVFPDLLSILSRYDYAHVERGRISFAPR